MITERRRESDKTYHELTKDGKIALHRLVQREATLEDLIGVVRIVAMIRSMLGLQASAK